MYNLVGQKQLTCTRSQSSTSGPHQSASRQHAAPRLLLIDIMQVFLCLPCSVATSVFGFAHPNVKCNTRIVPAVDETCVCLCFSFTGTFGGS